MEMNTVVFDTGTAVSKIGRNDEDWPKYIFATNSNVIKRGFIHDFDGWESMWEESLSRLYPDNRESLDTPCIGRIFLSEPPFSPQIYRKNIAERLFEKYGASDIYISPQGLLPLFSCGETSGIVLESGAGHTYTSAIYDGQIVPSSSFRMELSGNDVTSYLARILEMERGITFKASYNNAQCGIKENFCYVAVDFESECNIANTCNVLEEAYKLPDGTFLTLNSERFRAPEILFDPGAVGKEDGGIHSMIDSTVKSCSIDIRRDVGKNIILSGGTCLFPGMKDRIAIELKKLFPSNFQYEVFSPNDPYSVWIGGSVISSLSSFSLAWISKDEFKEHGERVFSTRIQN